MFKSFFRLVLLPFVLFVTTHAFAWCSSADDSLSPFLTGPVNNWEDVTKTTKKRRN